MKWCATFVISTYVCLYLAAQHNSGYLMGLAFVCTLLAVLSVGDHSKGEK